jgi:tripartite-type tricarboxylate transporter receptor subunit TctC
VTPTAGSPAWAARTGRLSLTRSRGYGVEPANNASGWNGIGAPKSTPTAIVEKLNNEINVIITDPNMKAHLVDLGVEPVSMTPAEFGKRIADDTEKWAKVVKFAGIKPD